MAQVHRFRDKVAAWLGKGETVYMTPAEAQKLARLLNAAARDVKARKFVDSQFNSTEFPISGEKD